MLERERFVGVFGVAGREERNWEGRSCSDEKVAGTMVPVVVACIKSQSAGNLQLHD